MSYLERLKARQAKRRAEPVKHSPAEAEATVPPEPAPAVDFDPEAANAQMALAELREIQHRAGVSLRFDDRGKAWMRFSPSLEQRDAYAMEMAGYAYDLFRDALPLIENRSGGDMAGQRELRCQTQN